jgi:hypothetical protein
MKSLPWSGTLLAQIDKWQEMGRDFRSDRPKFDPTILFACFGILLAIICAIWFLSRILTRQEGRRLFNSPRQLFRGLCRAHELNGADRRLLMQIARFENIPQPASLFLQPESFDSAARRPQFKEQAPQLRQLRGRLFRDLPSSSATDTASAAAAKG